MRHLAEGIVVGWGASWSGSGMSAYARSPNASGKNDSCRTRRNERSRPPVRRRPSPFSSATRSDRAHIRAVLHWKLMAGWLKSFSRPFYIPKSFAYSRRARSTSSFERGGATLAGGVFSPLGAGLPPRVRHGDLGKSDHQRKARLALLRTGLPRDEDPLAAAARPGALSCRHL